MNFTLPVKVEMTAKGWQLDRKTFTAMSKIAWQDAAEYWHEHILPKHFQPGAAREYQYKQRSRAYNKRKQRKYGHQLPLVYSGRMRDTLLRSADITGTSKGAKAKLPNIKYLYAYKPGQPNKAEELLRLSALDRQALAAAYNSSMTKQIEARDKQAESPVRGVA